MKVDEKDKALIALLRENSRTPVSELARLLSLSRTTVKDRIERLEKRGVISGYTVRLTSEYIEGLIQAHVMISSDPKYANQIVRQLEKVPEVTCLYAVNGAYDMIAVVVSDSIGGLDQALDTVGGLTGVNKTVSSIILSTKIER